ncbi:Cytochrome c oxidase subunit 6B [Mycoemilia scoparia]|uniref:Cytochrome c oxidase subunit 12, mitochondrial n=1 Tax=Mycoemilia scoparia TaxID=417184 RepID=A0A9W7ZZT2_9FUNG|nr:Cytochrome c oxidase subunit 6B [Mycoemilia scoparia]
MSVEAKDVSTPGFDARFPNVNQTKNCWQNFVDYNKCVQAKGEEYAPCKRFFKAFHSLCPDEWISNWESQKDNGLHPAGLE